MEVCWPPTCTCMRMQVVKSPVHMPSVTAKRWGVRFFTFNSEVISNCNSHCLLCTRPSPHYLVWPGNKAKGDQDVAWRVQSQSF